MNNYRLLLIYGLVAIMAIGCSKENKGNGGKEEPIDLGDEIAITFDMTVPATGGAATYAIASKDEHFVENLTAVLFEEVSGVEYYRYHTHATTIENGVTNAKRFRIQVKKSTRGEKYRIVALTNLPADHISDIVAGLVSASKDPQTFKKEDFLKEVNFKSIGKWNTTSSIDFTPLPMWGETPTMQPITTNLTPGQLGTIKLLRSLARVDVGLDMAASGGNLISQGLPNFKLETVKVYNASSSGAIAPLVANLSAVPGELKAENPTLPTGVGVNATAIDYTKAIVADWDKGFIRDIYIAESDVKGAATAQTRTCIILKGYYTAQGDPVNITVPTWYRIDFFKKALTGNPIEYLDILRNCRYHVNITKVSGPGYDTEAEAVNSLPMNLDAEVDVWDESEGMDDVTTDGQYHLVVNKHKFEFYRDGRERILEVFTDHPSGWKVLPADLPTWIHLAPQNSDGQTLPMTSKMDVSITLDPIDPAITDPAYFREGEFTITSGVMKKKIYVKQTNAQELNIEVTPNALVFRKSGSSAKSIKVTVYPASSIVHFSEVSGQNPIVWKPGGFPITGLPNLGTYTFQPDVNNSTDLLSATVTVYVKHTDGSMVSKIITINQLATDLLFESQVSNPYPSIGGTGLKFLVNSDTEWRIVSVNDPESALAAAFDNTLKDAATGYDYLFDLSTNNTWVPRNITFTPASPDLDFSGQPVVVTQNSIAPSLSIDKTSIDFGNAIAPAVQSVGATSNTKWKITTSGDWSNTMGGIAPAPGIEQGNHTYHTSNTNYVQLTAKAWGAAVGTPAAGTTFSATATFSTENHAPATGSTQNLTLKRVVPVHFSFTSLGAATIARVGGNIAVNVASNAAWKATPSVGAATANQSQSTYGPKTANVTVAANTTWSTSTVAVNRTVTVSALYGASTVSMVTSGGSKTLTQPGYYISALAQSLPTPASTGGTTASVTITGAYPAIAVRAAVGATQVSNAAPLVAAGESGARSASFTINANPSWTARTVFCQYQNPRNANTWTNVGGGVSQPGYAITAASASPQITAPIGGAVTIYLSGYRPAIQTRLLVAGIPTTIANVPASTGAQGSVNHTLPANTSSTATRAIFAQYNHPVNGWTEIASWTQETTNYQMPNGKYVAKTDISVESWAHAMGISTQYNGLVYPDNAQNYTLTYPQPYGCGAYSEPGYPAGTWRAPMWDEYRTMFYADLLTVARYWTNQPLYDNDPNWASSFIVMEGPSIPGSAVNSRTYKTNAARVRCIRN